MPEHSQHLSAFQRDPSQLKYAVEDLDEAASYTYQNALSMGPEAWSRFQSAAALLVGAIRDGHLVVARADLKEDQQELGLSQTITHYSRK